MATQSTKVSGHFPLLQKLRTGGWSRLRLCNLRILDFLALFMLKVLLVSRPCARTCIGYMVYSCLGKQLKLLACAECDLGPLGWSEESGSEFWLACARVGYSV